MGITNEEAITIIKNEFSEYADTLSVYAEKRKEAFDMAIKALEQTELNPSYNSVKTELEQTMWIPVSERLPEDYIHVLCQFTLGGMGECYLAHGAFHVVGGLVMTCNEVIAWMPLPEPYQSND